MFEGPYPQMLYSFTDISGVAATQKFVYDTQKQKPGKFILELKRGRLS